MNYFRSAYGKQAGLIAVRLAVDLHLGLPCGLILSLLFWNWCFFGATAKAQVAGLYSESYQVNVGANGKNIAGDAANEPSLCIDPANPNRIAIGWRQFDHVTNDFRQAGWAYSTNAGISWKFPGVLEPGTFRSDPVLA